MILPRQFTDQTIVFYCCTHRCAHIFDYFFYIHNIVQIRWNCKKDIRRHKVCIVDTAWIANSQTDFKFTLRFTQSNNWYKISWAIITRIVTVFSVSDNSVFRNPKNSKPETDLGFEKSKRRFHLGHWMAEDSRFLS